ncbi:MAG TPA: hypothetical protein VHP35_01365 [Terriglobia bacterium]|nr:hypothetical protein [Terriglobia bacterium]
MGWLLIHALVIAAATLGSIASSSGQSGSTQEGKQTVENINASESERFGKRAAEKIAGAAEATDQKLDAAVDYVESAKQNAKQTPDQVRQEGWKGMKGRVLEYTRHEPFNALIIAVGAGVFLGWLATRPRE